jgi:hypothetical protein
VQLPRRAPTRAVAWNFGSASTAACSSSRTVPASPPSPRPRRSSSARAARPTAIAPSAPGPHQSGHSGSGMAFDTPPGPA